MILILVGLDGFAIHAADVRMLLLVAVGQHHVVADLVLGHVRHGAGAVALAVQARSEMRFAAMTTWHLSLLFALIAVKLSVSAVPPSVSAACGRSGRNRCACCGRFPG